MRVNYYGGLVGQGMPFQSHGTFGEGFKNIR